jgi:DNA repair protein RecO (recombination protein O)
MLQVTKGIVFHYVKYSENSVIVKIFTHHLGIQSYILRGLNTKKNKQQRAYLQPLSLIEIEAIQKENRAIQSLKAIKIDYAFQSIPFNIYKSSIAFFLAEVLVKTIKEEEANASLFDFISSSLILLDKKPTEFSNFHLIFLAQLSSHFGFQPQLETYSENSIFNLQEGSFSNQVPPHAFFANESASRFLYQLFSTSFENMEEIKLSNNQRKELLSILLDYYSLHIHNLSNLKSRDVFEELFS